MSKINVFGLLMHYIETLHTPDDNSLYPFDIVIHLAAPALIAAIAFWMGDRAAIVRSYFANGITAVSIVSGFMCGLAIMVFELRANLAQDGSVASEGDKVLLVDELFSDILWSVVSGFLTVSFMVMSGDQGDKSLWSVLSTSLSLGFLANFILVTLMCIKRIDICYRSLSKR